jgi:hypothetical protein
LRWPHGQKADIVLPAEARVRRWLIPPQHSLPALSSSAGEKEKCKMATEDAFNAAKTVFTLYGGFFQDVAAEIGMEKALALHARRGEAFGAMLAAMTKERLGGREFDLKTFAAVESEAEAQGFGMTGEIAEGPASIKINWARCSLYEGFSDAGLDHETITQMCNCLTAVEFAGLNQAFPPLSGSVKVRSAPDEPCVEEFVYAK